MSVKFQFNKVSMQALQKQLKIRIEALPTLKSKEAYLRITIKKEKQQIDGLRQNLRRQRENLGESERLFAEFPIASMSLDTVDYTVDNVAGTTIPVLSGIRLKSRSSISVLEPSWMSWGRKTVAEMARLTAEIDVAQRRLGRLEYARKKTTQKVNLYEKVQIPEFSEAVLKIKRYMEDVENLEKSAQKITKARKAASLRQAEYADG